MMNVNEINEEFTKNSKVEELISLVKMISAQMESALLEYEESIYDDNGAGVSLLPKDISQEDLTGNYFDVNGDDSVLMPNAYQDILSTKEGLFLRLKKGSANS